MEWCITHLSQLIKFMELWAVTCLVGSRNQLDPTAFHTSNFSVESVRFDDCSHIYRFVGSNGMQIETMPLKISFILMIGYHGCLVGNRKSDPKGNPKRGIRWDSIDGIGFGRIRWETISDWMACVWQQQWAALNEESYLWKNRQLLNRVCFIASRNWQQRSLVSSTNYNAVYSLFLYCLPICWSCRIRHIHFKLFIVFSAIGDMKETSYFGIYFVFTLVDPVICCSNDNSEAIYQWKCKWILKLVYDKWTKY